MAQPTPFTIALPEEQLKWINDRVATARIPPGKKLPDDEVWKSWGLPPDYAHKLKEYWTSKYDWRQVEKQLNDELTQFTIPINHGGEDVTIHFVHHRSERKDAIPFLFVHGWPGSFLEVRPLINLLTSPASSEDPAYHVVAPSLPGFGFSSYPSAPCSPMDMAEINHKLMKALGYSQYMVQGGDWGSMVNRIIAINHPESCRIIHLNMVVASPPIWYPLAIGRLILAYLTGLGLSNYEKKLLERMKWWMDRESGYQKIQGTKPQTLSYALTDSPLGMACWLREKVNYLVDDDFQWKDEDVITWAMVSRAKYIFSSVPSYLHSYSLISSMAHQDMPRSTSGFLLTMINPC
jgi:pimeloyl-ACP methyl ester carboxylesterase